MDHYEIPEGDGLRRMIRTPLEEAIYDVLGGMVPAAEALGVKRQHVHYWLSTKRLRDRDIAVRLAEATMKVGRPVPVTELLDLEPWRGPERHDGTSGPTPGKRRRGAKKSRLGLVVPPSASSEGDAGSQAAEAKLKRTCPTCHKTACTRFCNSADSFEKAA